MAKPYSLDLRVRLVTAVEWDDMSLSATSRTTGSVSAGQMGRHRDWLLEREGREIIFRGLVAELPTRAVKEDCVQVWRRVHAEG